MPSHLTLVNDPGAGPPTGPIQLGITVPGLPDGDIDFWSLTADERIDAYLDCDPGRRAALTVADEIAGQLDLLVDGLTGAERSRVAASAYLDADGIMRSRRQQLRAI